MSTHEIERVFLLDRLPDLPDGAEAVRVEQGYLPEHDSAGEEITEGRVRRTADANGTIRFTHTVKRGVGLVRSETERAITEAEFEHHWPRTDGRRLTKTRYRVPAGALVWEIDAFDDLELVLAEVELPAPDAAAPLPEWLASHVVREVTDEPAYRNYEIAMRVRQRRDSVDPDS